MTAYGPETSSWRGRPLWLEIDLDALVHNVQTLKRQASPASLAAVVKANAYGHGAVAIAQTVIEAGADRLAVICVDEAEELRQAGIKAPILVLGHTPVCDAQRVVDLRLTPTVNCRELALSLADHASSVGIVQPVHLKVDTGLNRYGLLPGEVIPLAETLRDIPSLKVEGIFTHFASSDEADKAFTHEQFRTFMTVAERLSWVPVRHASNTANLLDLPEMNLDMVRPGLGIYGLYPSSHANDLGLRPVLSLKSRIVRLHRISAGESVSYGRAWRARRPTLIGLIMCGYGDGLPRALSNRGSLLVQGRRAPLVGRVCMDMCMLDVTDVAGVAEGDEVVVIGSQGTDAISADEVARLCDTISYEVLCGVSRRAPRFYLRNGEPVAAQTLVSPLNLASLEPATPGLL